MLIGNLTRDPETRTIDSNRTVTRFGLATNRVWKDQNGNKQEEAQFHNITAFGRLAEICAQYLKKGSKIYVEGRIRNSSYTSQDGQTKYWSEIIIENMQMLSSRTDFSAMQGQPAVAPGYQAQNQPVSASQQETHRTSEAPVEDQPVITEDEPSEVLKKEESKNEEEEEVSMEDIPF